MSIYQLNRSNIQSTKQVDSKLRAGQIVQGKINKLYPNNKALISIGTKQMVAQLKASLMIGERYHFQVEHVDEVVHLRVISDRSPHVRTSTLADVCTYVGVKDTNINRQFIQSLIQQGIPFTKQSLSQAIARLESNGKINDDLSFRILQTMIRNDFPLTERVFQSLMTFHTTSLTSELKSFRDMLQNQTRTPLVNELIQHLETYGSPAKNDVQKAFNTMRIRITNNDPYVATLLKMSGFIPLEDQQEIPSRTIKQLNIHHYSRFMHQIGLTNEAHIQTSFQQLEQIIALQNKTSEHTRMPLSGRHMHSNRHEQILSTQDVYHTIIRNLPIWFPHITGKQIDMITQQLPLLHQFLSKDRLDSQQTDVSESMQPNQFARALQQLVHLYEQKENIQQQGKSIIDTWSRAIQVAHIQQTPLIAEKYDAFLRQLDMDWFPHLPDEQATHVRNQLVNNAHVLHALLQVVRHSSNEQFYQRIEEMLPLEQVDTPVKQHFSSLVQDIMTRFGLTYEADIFHHEQGKTNQTFKGLLLQFLQENNVGTSSERGQSILQFIQGLQMQSVQETPHFVHASIIIPGEKFNLMKDIQVDLESKKTENGKINPDYCRILFYLHLANLEETVLDVHIQKRHVTITVYNNNSRIQQYGRRFQPALQQGLASIHYVLTNVSYAPLQSVKENKNESQKIAPQGREERFDLRI